MYKPFQRKVNAKGFKDLTAFDKFIQSTLDKFTFVDPSEDLYKAVGVYSKYIISNKSTIPDLIIYNKTFNKNDCFETYIGKGFNKFPRVRFILKGKPKKKNNKEEKEIEVEVKEEEENKNEDESCSEVNNEELTNPNAFFEHIQESEKNLNEMKSKNEEETKKDFIKKQQDVKKVIPPIKNNFPILQSQSEGLSFIESKPQEPIQENPKEEAPKIEELPKETVIPKEETKTVPVDDNKETPPENKDIKMPFIPPNIPPFMMFPPYNPSTPPGMMNPMGFPIPQVNMMNYYSPFPLEDDDDDDPLYCNFAEDYQKYNPSVFLENPVLIVKKNLFQRNWIIMRNNKVYMNFNSEELLMFLSEEIRKGNKFENMSVSDYNTDVFFRPTNLFDILRKSVPKLKRKYFQMNLMQQQKKVNNNVSINKAE